MIGNNEVRLSGNVVKEPETIDTTRGRFGKIRIAVNSKRNGQEEALFIDVKMFGNSFADLDYYDIAKGDRVIVNGRLVVEKYCDKNGIERSEPVVYANGVVKLYRKPVAASASGF